jgi:hypothetical protein
MKYLSNIVRSEGDPKIVRSGRSSLDTFDRLAKGLGWFSLGLGLAELLAPRAMTRALGMEGAENLVRGYGVREIGAGVLCLSVDKRAGLWSRVAGDGLDIATLLTGLRNDNPRRNNVGLALFAVAAITLLDVVGAQLLRGRKGRQHPDLYTDRSGFPKGVRAARAAARDLGASSRRLQATHG